MRRILIVEGNKALRDCYEEVLAEDGYEVLTAMGCAEALAKNLMYSPDVVVMDPGLDRSSEAAEEMTRVNRRLRVVFHTADLHRGIRDFSYWIADALAPKGEDPRTIREVIRHLGAR